VEIKSLHYVFWRAEATYLVALNENQRQTKVAACVMKLGCLRLNRSSLSCMAILCMFGKDIKLEFKPSSTVAALKFPHWQIALKSISWMYEL